ncbi:MAG: IS3 family transposase [Chloroflexi bacterium]|nr:IS3 family transposase [Chloroflexota bacterium]
MKVSDSGYYAWVDRPPSRRAQEEVRLELEIMVAHNRTRQTYGPERLQRDLSEHGVRVGIWRIKRIRKKLGIRCKQKRRFKATTNSALSRFSFGLGSPYTGVVSVRLAAMSF